MKSHRFENSRIRELGAEDNGVTKRLQVISEETRAITFTDLVSIIATDCQQMLTATTIGTDDQCTYLCTHLGVISRRQTMATDWWTYPHHQQTSTAVTIAEGQYDVASEMTPERLL